MIIERSMHPDWLSNTYLVASDAGSEAFFVDAGGPTAPLLTRANELDLKITHVLLTHHHFDHVAELDAIRQQTPGVEVLAHADERAGISGSVQTLTPNDEISLAGLTVKLLPTPGHTKGMLSFYVNDSAVFTGDTLFKGSVGGVRAPGHTTFDDLKSSIMDTLLTLPSETAIQPGHTSPTTVAEELENNPFVRIWRGIDPEGDDRCVALGEPATLVLWAPDYDGGHKAWIRWSDGSDDIVPGSKVEKA